MKRGTILWDRFMQQLVEVESVNKNKTWFMLCPIWSSPQSLSKATMWGRPPKYIDLFCTPIWKDFYTSKKKIAKNPLYQFHDTESFGVEIHIKQPFYRTIEYIGSN